jgi:hypothetical protein
MAMKEDLPVNSNWWKEWRVRMERLICKNNAKHDLTTLLRAGCAEDSLFFRLASISSWHKERLARKASLISVYQIKTTPNKLREAADLIDGIEDMFRFHKREFPNAPELAQTLRAYAKDWEETLPFMLHPGRMNMRVTAVCSLVAYVKRATNKNHDKEVSSLLGAVLSKDSYEAKNLAQWRNKYKKEIDLLGDFVVTPR